MEETPRSGLIELAVVLRFVDIATDALGQAREEIDALNVYPVPDGDTGTNMFLTVSAARDAIREAAEAAEGAEGGNRDLALAAFGRGALLGARGNSGVILSEMLGAIARRISAAAPGERNAEIMADALHQATEASYAAVGRPVEGTMLTVARAASEAAVALAGDPQVRARDVFTAAARAAREALARTPEQLQILKDAGVVDAGGRGLSVILDAAETALTGRRPVPVASPIGRHAIPIPLTDSLPAGDLSPDGPAYEVMYLLDAAPEAIPALRETLDGLGDSLVVVGGEGLWNVHVHVDDVGAAIEAGIEAGRPHRVRVTHFAEQVAAARHGAGHERDGRRIVSVAAGPGLAALFEEAGALVVPGGPGRRPSTGQILEAITDCGASEVVVLPNDADSVRVAQIAGQMVENDPALAGRVRVAVIPTQAQVQGLAALAVHEPARSFEQDVLEMTATARHARHGAVTVAARQAMTMAGPCEPGDVLGVIAGDFAVVGHDLDEVATGVLARLLAGGGELVTLVSGAGGDGLAERAAAWVDQRHPHVDVVVYDGGQERYPLLLSVE
ncbi:DAK2 domain-containing protein [Nocardioides sp. cx-173]|uniref:DAK2 domain-containing protein n=1 Tax=Nocardioides sp. cx-173 TaxID=2898796 RepID=UPI001E3B845F|nr:DAK2 domain-containing protein [Nocardioides sp. cx-173]MCD4524747.1 DAK2 domain-containing protein [Nocardioides sp. cx-173]UGB43256.1 DAK2 domain-containing protein [Nocardioides sp. cx-173]